MGIRAFLSQLLVEPIHVIVIDSSEH